MLQKLTIHNFILIKELEILPDHGMNVITGETGAGKSILLGAIGLLMGQRADSKSLYDETQKCVIEGQFQLSGKTLEQLFIDNDLDYENPCIIRREISVAGKSRAFVNDTPVNLEQLDNIVGELLDVHSQNETLLLKKQNYQTQLLDDFAQNGTIKLQFQQSYQAYKKAEKKHQDLLAASKASAQELDYISYTYKELDEAKLSEEEQEKLESEQLILENAEDIKAKLTQAHNALDGEEFSILSGLQTLSVVFDHLAGYSPEYHAIKEKLTNMRLELRDINREIESFNDRTETNPKRLVELQDRLSLLYKLQRKHVVSSTAELLAIHKEFGAKLSRIENSDSELHAAQTEAKEAESKMLELGNSLSETRKNATLAFEKNATERLALLGMPNATFHIQLSEAIPTAEGLDKITFLFSANKGIAPRPIADVASGGEFSRLMLVIKYLLASKKQMPTIIFDEIDTGVSGEVAHNMAEMLEDMANRHQVFTITHLPQMASKGSAHFFVYKDNSTDRTVSHIRRLTKEERVMEIAKMVGGKTPSESAILSAREMLG